MADKIVVELDFKTINEKDNPFDNIEKKSKQANVVINNFGENVKKNNQSILSSFDKITVATSNMVNVLLGAKSTTERGLFSQLTKLTGISSAMLALSFALENIDSKFAKTSATILRFSSILITGFAGAITFAIAKLASLGFEASTRFIKSLSDISDKSNQLQKEVLVLNSFIDNYNKVTNSAIGSSNSWAQEIESLSSRLNISNKDLNKSAREIISVASQYGFAESQLKNLLKISAEYAKVNGKDVFNTTLAVVSALAGNAQSVQSLGIKLSEASVKQFAFNKGLTDNFEKLTENSKAQVRYQKLLSQFSNINGIAEKTAKTLADQENALAVTTEKVSNAFGRGVSKIENFNLLTLAVNKTIGFFNEGIFEAAGTITAIGARILQVGSLLAGLSIKVYIAIKAYTLLNDVLSSNAKITQIVTSNIPILNSSISALISNLTNGRITVDLITKSLASFRLSLINIFPFLGNLSGATKGFISIGSTLIAVFRGLLVSITATFAKALPIILTILAPLLKITAIVGLVVGSLNVLKEAFLELENRTKVFTKIYAILTKSLNDSVVIFDPLIKVFNKFKEVIFDLAQRAFGLLISAIAKTVSVISSLVAKNPFNLFSKDTVQAFASIENQLDSFNRSLADNGYKLDNFNSNVSRNIAGAKDSASKDLKDLRNELEYTSDKFDEVSKKIGDIFANGLVNIIRFGAESIGEALQKGIFSFENFGSAVIGLIGDISIQLGVALIAAGKGIEALRNSVLTLFGGQAIAAGIALVALGGFLKSYSSSKSGSSTAPSASGGGGSGVSRNRFPSPENDLSRPNDDLISQRDTGGGNGSKTNVTVNIQGDVLDSDETGTRIVNLINNAFDKQGVVINSKGIA